MIEVTCDQTGDEGLADSMSAALVAARTLMEDARENHARLRVQGTRLTVTFRDGSGAIVRARVSERTVWSAIARAREEEGP